ncbi:MAG: hypothetical protein K6F84_08745 [Lachnospiraceae bacterium]|nr:hypothetical protein [Lachnospiraceae bacterium]
MEKRILTYRKYMDDLIEDINKGEKKPDLEKIKSEHLVQISFFQHERFIHLCVTILFAILTFMSIFVVLITQNVNLIILVLALLVLLIPYIRHYYILENETQKMYWQYDLLSNMLIKHVYKDPNRDKKQ